MCAFSHRPRALLATALLLAACASSPPLGTDVDPRRRDASASHFETDAGAHIVRIVDADTVVIARGSRHGFVPPGPGARMGVSPRPAPTNDRATPAVRFAVRSAAAKVVTVGPDETTLDLEHIAAPIAVGDYVTWTARAPEVLRDDPVARCAYLDIGMRTLDGEALLELHTLLEGGVEGGAAASRAIVDRMLVEVHAQAELAKEVHTVPADGGRFVGLDLSGAFARSTHDDVLAFLDFVATFPAKYMTWNWKFVEIYGTWIINRTPPGESLHTKRTLGPLENEARAAVRAHDLTRAAAAWRSVLVLDPVHARALSGLAQIASLTQAETALGHDPQDRPAAWKRAKALGDLGLDSDAVVAWEALIAAGYRTRDARKERCYRLAYLERWDEAAAEIDSLLAEEHDPGLVLWRDYLTARRDLVRALARQGSGDEQARAHLEIGRIREQEKNWDTAAADYRRALDVARAPELRERATLGQLRAVRRADLASDDASVLTAIDDHEISRARERAHALLDEYRSLGLDADIEDALERFADRADAAEERELQGELLSELARLRPDDPEVHTRLGWHHVEAGRWDDARAAMGRALKIKPGHTDVWARRSMAWLLVATGRYDEARTLATPGADDDADLAHTLMRVAVTRGELAEARRFAVIAAELEPTRFGEGVRAVERLTAATRRPDAAAVLSRVRALITIGLPTQALAELPKLAADRVRQREAAWTIAEASWIWVPGDWALAAARVEGGSSPERKRLLIELEARHAFAVEPSSTTRRALAEALIARGRYHEAVAQIGGGTTETDGPARRVDRSLQDLRAKALRGLAGIEQSEHAAAATRRGDHATAARHHGRARADHTWAGAPSMVLQSATDELRALLAAGQKAVARAHAEAWLGPAKADGNPFLALDIEVNLARLASDDAPMTLEALYERHLATCVALEREHCEAVVRTLRSGLASTRGRADDAVAEAEAARRLWVGLYDAKSARSAALELANIRHQRGELAEAMQLAEAAYREATKADDAEHERSALLVLGTTALRVGDAEAARRWLSAARTAAERSDDAGSRAAAAYWLGRVALDLEGDLATASVELERAKRLLEAREERAEVMAVTVVLARADPKRALALTERLVEDTRPLERKVLLAEVLVARARALLDAGRRAEATPLGDEARALVATIDLPDLRARALHLAGDVARAAGDGTAATNHFVAAARAVAETLRRTGAGLPLGADTARVIDAAIAGLYKEGRTAEAIEIVELQRFAQAGRLIDLGRLRSDDRVLSADLEALGRARAENELARQRLHAEDDKPPADQDVATKQALSQVAARSEQEVAALLMKLQRDHRALFGALAVSPLTLVQRRAALPRNVLVVDYFIASDALFAFVVRREDAEPRAFRIEVPRDRLTQTIARHRTLLAQDGRLAEALARDLHDWLLAPLDDIVPADQRAQTTVVVIAEGPLQYVPFGALVTSRRGEPTRYAVERWRLATALSTTIHGLFEPPPKRSGKPSVLAFLDPTGELPGAHDELSGLLNVTTYKGAQATFAAFEREASRHPILHFATHGRLDPDPMQNGLGLADQTLTVDRVSRLTGLRNKTRLVVLSACQTATELGSVIDQPDDEVISMARGFAIAGVPSIVASLWDVDDRATRRLMHTFYTELGDPRRDTLEALRRAQLAMIAEPNGADPRLWAAFHLIGDWR